MQEIQSCIVLCYACPFPIFMEESFSTLSLDFAEVESTFNGKNVSTMLTIRYWMKDQAV